MARKSASPAEPVRTQLMVPLSEAETKLSERIEKGKELLNRILDPNGNLDDSFAEGSSWSSYNSRLLKNLFSADELAQEYSAFYGRMIRINPSRQDRINQYRDGVKDGIHRLESIVGRLALFPESAQRGNTAPDKPPRTGPKTRVFIVHGHDGEAKQSVARFLERLDLDAIILHEQPSAGRTIIEKLEHYSDVHFAVVLLTPDDVGAPQADAENLKPRARQNVILELGVFIGRLGRKNVCALYKGDVELPTDVSGVLYVPMVDETNWKGPLAKELEAAGFSIDFAKVYA